MSVRSVYWAGDLFDHKDLIGNLMLSQAFDRLGAGRWRAVLPQCSESNAERGANIRDMDLSMLVQCDAVVANFDGTDLDSGTVVEFCFSKFLDLPTVLLRTDFRDNNDRSTCPDPWNLMCSGYPRTRTVLVNAMSELARFPDDPVGAFCDGTAAKVLAALDAATAEPAWSAGDPVRTMTQYRLALAGAGGRMPELFPVDRLELLVAEKIARGIYHA